MTFPWLNQRAPLLSSCSPAVLMSSWVITTVISESFHPAISAPQGHHMIFLDTVMLKITYFTSYSMQKRIPNLHNLSHSSLLSCYSPNKSAMFLCMRITTLHSLNTQSLTSLHALPRFPYRFYTFSPLNAYLPFKDELNYLLLGKILPLSRSYHSFHWIPLHFSNPHISYNTYSLMYSRLFECLLFFSTTSL